MGSGAGDWPSSGRGDDGAYGRLGAGAASGKDAVLWNHAMLLGQLIVVGGLVFDVVFIRQ